MDNNKTINVSQLVVAEFSSKSVIEHFTVAAKSGLWKSEQTLISRYFRPNSRTLDLGCGVGRTTLPLIKQGFDVVGLDISQPMIEAARQLALTEGISARYEVGNAVQLKFSDNSFDQVIFSNQGWTQIPGIENRLSALREIRRVLVSDGMFLFSTHIRPRAVLHPTWLLRWIRHYGFKLVRKNCEEIDFGDLFFVRKLPVEHSMKQFVHIPTFEDVQRLLHSQSFELLETMGENSIVHNSLVYIAKLNSKAAPISSIITFP